MCHLFCNFRVQKWRKCYLSLPVFLCQRIVSRDASSTRSAALICYRSKLSSSVLNPSEHVGEHIAGARGWRAWGGSAGIDGGAITSGGDIGGADAQPVTSGSSAHSSDAGDILSKFGIVGSFLHRLGALLLE